MDVDYEDLKSPGGNTVWGSTPTRSTFYIGESLKRPPIYATQEPDLDQALCFVCRCVQFANKLFTITGC